MSCGGLRYLRSACLSCGLPHNLEFPMLVKLSLPNEDDFIQADATVLEHARLNAIAAGIVYIDTCGHEHNIFKEFGGDIIFLFRNLVHSAGLNGHISEEVASLPSRRDEIQMSLQAARSFAGLIQRWTTEHVRMNNEIEMEEILNIVEALHALAQLGIENDDSLPLATEISAMLTTLEHPICTNTRVRQDDFKTVESSRLKRKKTFASQNSRFQVRDVKRRLQEAILQFDVTDMLGYDPTKRQVPLTDAKHCAHCGKVNSRGVTSCVDCNAFLRARIDYGSLTDALVWSYLFEEIGVPLVCNNADVSFVDVVTILPAVRAYQRIDELGHDFFRLQCYFVTHFIYVMSDWGRHTLRRELFEEELVFIASNLTQVIFMEDPELTGEFLQCLRILGVSRLDSTIWPLIHHAMTYLLELERRHGGQGAWSKRSDMPYDRYHTAYCATVGLMSYGFSQVAIDSSKASSPIPRAFQVRVLG